MPGFSSTWESQWCTGEQANRGSDQIVARTREGRGRAFNGKAIPCERKMPSLSDDYTAGGVILSIPFVRQTHEFTCGAACLMMAMKYFDPAIVLSEDLEIDIWREANLVEDWATCGRGLAYSAAKRGYGAEIIASVDDIPFRERIFEVSPKANREVLDFFFRDLKKRALSMNVPETRKEVTLEEISRSIRRNAVPILLTDSKFLHCEGVPHWVVVRGWNSKGFLVHDPLWEAPRNDPIRWDLLDDIIGYGSGEVLINVLSKQT